jgi:hypothetical protein
MIPKPTAWYPGKIYQMRRVKQGGGQMKPATAEVKVKMTVRYSVVNYSIPNVIIPSGASTRDVLIAWWNAVERNQVKDPNILCLSRNPEMFEFQDDTGGTYFDIEEGMEIFLIPKDRTSPEVVRIDVTWGGFDKDGLPIRLSICPKVHRETPRSRLLSLWLEHYQAQPEYQEVASHMFTDDSEYYWKDHTGIETAPPWSPGQQVIFKMKPWSKENTAERQRKRPKPPPADGRDPLRPSLGQGGTPGTGASVEKSSGGTDEGDQTTQPSGGTNDRMTQYVPLRRPCPTRQVSIKVVIGEKTIDLKVDPKIVIKDLVHKTAQAIEEDLPGWWHASVVDGKGDNRTYQEGDTIKLYAATQDSISRVIEPRTSKGQVALIPKAIGGPPAPPKKVKPKKRNWIQELRNRGEVEIEDARQFAAQIDREKMITMTTDGGANPNPGPAGWGVLVRQNGKFICL